MQRFFLCIMAMAIAIPTFAQIVMGKVLQSDNQPAANARVTLFQDSGATFLELRTNTNGDYRFENLDVAKYRIGVAKPGFQYLEKEFATVGSTLVFNIQLEDLTEKGRWNIIMDSPEPLGGTDLGVLMPNGNIYYCHNTKDPFFFLPKQNDTASAVGSTQVQGCVGPALLSNGQVLFLGGTLQEIYGPGSKKVKTFDSFTNKWMDQPDLLDYRWYPTVVPLFDQRLLVVGGGGLNNPLRVKTSEVYDPFKGISKWSGNVQIGNEVSAIVPLYTGKILMTHRPPQLFDPLTLEWNLAADFVQGNRMPNGDHCDHELVQLSDGRVVAVGYKSFTPDRPGVSVELYDPLANKWTLANHFPPTRSRAKAVLLPDQNVLVLGGFKEESKDPTPTNKWGYMNLSDLYNPLTNSWRRLANMNIQREYHAISTLVPDGRVIVVGGEGTPGNEPPKSVIEAFYPPYLFRGVRPELNNFNKTTFGLGENIHFEVHKTNALSKVVLLSHAVMTHFMNSGNSRFLELDFTQNGSLVSAKLPNDPLLLMSGWYMLFGLVDDIPSVAQIVKIEADKLVSSNQSLVVVNNKIQISPNPTNLEYGVKIEMTLAKNSRVKFILHNVLGEKVQEFSFMEMGSGNHMFSLPVNGLSQGIFFLSTWINGEPIGTEKIVIKG